MLLGTLQLYHAAWYNYAMIQKLPVPSYPEHASERTQIVFDLLDVYRVDNNISPEMPLTVAQVAEICQIVTHEAAKIEGIYLSRAK